MNPEFMQKAIRLALENVDSGRGGPFGAVVVKDGKVVAAAANEVLATKDPSAHAEVVAIRRASKALDNFDLSGCELYTSCEPCPMCLALIYWSRIDIVYYASAAADAAAAGFDDAVIYREMGLRKDERSISMSQSMRAEALKAFEAWQKKDDKVLY